MADTETPDIKDSGDKPSAKTTTAASTTNYRYVGWHAVEVFMADGSLPWVGPGDYIELTDGDLAIPANAELQANLQDATGVVIENGEGGLE